MPQKKFLIMDLARELGRIGDWEFDIQSGELSHSEEFKKILDLPVGHKMSGWTEIERLCLAESQGKLSFAWQDCVNRGVLFNLIVEARTYRERNIWLRIVARPIRDTSNKVIGVQGALQDVTESKFRERKIIESEQEFRDFSEAMPHIVWTAKVDGSIDYVNGSYVRYTGMTLENSRAWASAVHSDDVEGCLQEWRRAVATSTPFALECRLYNQALNMYCWHSIKSEPMFDEGGALRKWYGIATDIHDYKRLNEEFISLGYRLNATFESMSEGLFILSHDLKFTYVNGAAECLLNTKRSDLIGETVRKAFPELLPPSLEEFLINSPSEFKAKCYHSKSRTWLEVRTRPSKEGVSVFLKNITDQKVSALKLERTSRALRRLSKCNSALVRSDSESDLLHEICKIILEEDDHQAAFVALKEIPFPKEPYLASYNWTSQKNRPSPFQELDRLKFRDPQCPVIQSISGHQPVVINALSEVNTEWAKHMIGCGFSSGICLPLRDKKIAIGSLVLLHYKNEATLQADIALLMELADNLAYGISNIRADTQRAQSQNAIVQLAASTSIASGLAFFQNLTRNMTEALGADAGFVAQTIPSAQYKARTLAAIIDGELVENFDYLVEDTPCRALAYEDLCIIPDNVANQFPASPSLANLGAQAYVGHRLENSDGMPVGFLVVLYRHRLFNTDLIIPTLKIFADRAAAEIERAKNQARLRDQASLLDKAHDAIIVHDLQHKISFWNRSSQRLYGWPESYAMGRLITELVGHNASEFNKAYEHTCKYGEWEGEYLCYRHDGKPLTVEGSWTLMRDHKGEPQSIFTIETDISARKEMEAVLIHQARHDSLTGLPNRAYFYEQLERAIRRSRRNNSKLSLLYFDIDKFKIINDSYGHDVGDEVIKNFAQRVKGVIRDVDFMSRVGGDEFTLILEDLTDSYDANVVAEKIIQSMQDEVFIKKYSLKITTSIGVASYHSKFSADEFVKRADEAMYRAKSSGRNNYRR